MPANIPNAPAPRVSYFTPAQYPPSGAAAEDDPEKVPTLFKPIKIRGVEFHNRIWVGSQSEYGGCCVGRTNERRRNPILSGVPHVPVFCTERAVD